MTNLLDLIHCIDFRHKSISSGGHRASPELPVSPSFAVDNTSYLWILVAVPPAVLHLMFLHILHGFVTGELVGTTDSSLGLWQVSGGWIPLSQTLPSDHSKLAYYPYLISFAVVKFSNQKKMEFGWKLREILLAINFQVTISHNGEDTVVWVETAGHIHSKGWMHAYYQLAFSTLYPLTSKPGNSVIHC